MFHTVVRMICCLAVSSGATLSVRAPKAPERTPAEFEPVQAVLLQWRPGPSNGLYAFLVEHVLLAGATPVVVVLDRSQQAEINEYMRRHGIATKDVDFVVQRTDSAWVRDYSAIPFYEDSRTPLAFADFLYQPEARPRDDLAPLELCSDFRAPVYRARRSSDSLLLEGGDFLTDGYGTVFTSVTVAEANGGTEQVAERLSQFLAVDQVHFMPHLSTAPPTHIDMHLKLLDEETLLLGAFAGGGRDAGLRATEEYLAGLRTCYGGPYRVVRVPFFVIHNRRRKPVLCTYTNALIVNNYVLVPLYGARTDQQALLTYELAMPGYHVAGYDCSHSIRAGGAIHCMTREIPAERVVCIAHPRFTRSYCEGETIVFQAACWAHERVDRVTLHIGYPDGLGSEIHEMTAVDGVYRADVVARAPGELRYFIRAEAGDLVGYKPQNGYDSGYLSLYVVAGQV